MSKATLTLRPAASTLTWMGVIAAPFLIFPLWQLPELVRTRDWGVAAIASFAGVFALGVWLVLEVATVRVLLTEDHLCFKKYWRTRWAVRRDRAELRLGGVGDIPVLPGFRVFDACTGEQVGAISFSQFHRDDLEALERALTS